MYNSNKEKITNLTTGQKVSIEHKDNGTNAGSILFSEFAGSGECNPVCGTNYDCVNGSCVIKKGNDNCKWDS